MPPAESQSEEYAINLAQSEFRDGINTADPERAMSVISEFFVWMRDGEPSFWGREGNRALRAWLQRMNAAQTKLTLVPDNCYLYGDNALARGWEVLETNTSLDKERFRYFQSWERSSDGNWRMTSFICNRDVPPAMLGD